MRVFGPIEGIEVGSVFANRRELAAAGVHRHLQAGITGTPREGAESIVVSGGYEDDEDLADVILYTGHGGNDRETGRQIANQSLTGGNLALAVNCTAGLPVRVVRGYRLRSPFAPRFGYRYDGLYRVERYWSETGRSGFKIWRFLLERADLAPPPWGGPAPLPLLRELPAGYDRPERRTQVLQRIVRQTEVVRRVKELHSYRCQTCTRLLITPAGPYAEGAHIKPLGAGHRGPDTPDNVLCLCPNCHVLFDLGGFSLDDDLNILDLTGTGLAGSLVTHPRHPIAREHLAYHRALFSY